MGNIKNLMVPKIISYFGGTNTIFTDCTKFKFRRPRKFGAQQALEVDDLIFKGRLKGR